MKRSNKIKLLKLHPNVEQESFHIPKKIAGHMYELACAETPQEACGMLGGLGTKAVEVYPTRNLSVDNITYEVDPVEAFDNIKKMRDEGNEFIASWHSHPQNAAFPSIVDVTRATDDTLIYVIVSLLHGEGTIGAFRIKDGWVKELDVIIEKNSLSLQ